MRKIQKLERKDGYEIYLVYLPKSEIEIANLKKGDEVEVTAEGEGKITLTRINESGGTNGESTNT